MKKHARPRKTLALLLAALLVLALLPGAALAESLDRKTDADGKITFMGLARDIAQQTVEAGTLESDLNLPNELGITITDSEAQETEATITVSGWTSDPAYAGDKPGAYAFVPSLVLPDGCVLAEGLTAPQITVTVKEPVASKMEGRAATLGASTTWIDHAASGFDSGNGSAQAPYKIVTAEQLAYLAKTVNEGESYKGKYFEQTTDIDLAGYEWIPIGRDYPTVCAFEGSYDGGNHQIRNMVIASIAHSDASHHTYYAGFFGVVGHTYTDVSGFDKHIKNIKLIGIHIDATLEADKQSCIGGLFAEYRGFKSAVTNCSVQGNIDFAQGGYNKYSGIGGLVGNINSTLTFPDFTVFDGCIADVNIIAQGEEIGGFAGEIPASTHIKNCRAIGNVTVDTGDARIGRNPYVGGFFGWGMGQPDIRSRTIIESCYATGNITLNTAENSAFSGGFGGAYQDGISIKNCFATGHISVDSKSGTNAIGGGFIGGVSEATIEHCYAAGSVSAQGATGLNRAYGFSGNTSVDSTIQSCAALGAAMMAGTVSPFLSTSASIAASGNIWYGDMVFPTANSPVINQAGGSAISAANIYMDGTIGGLFNASAWTTEDGKLPGLLGKTVDMPEHLIPSDTATLHIKKDGAAWSGHGKSFVLKLSQDESITANMTGTGGTMAASVRYGIWKIYDGATDTGVSITVGIGGGFATLNYYTATVNNGTGSGVYVQDATVSITATVPIDKEFDKWTSTDGDIFAAASSISTTFTMPGHAVTVTATYKDSNPDPRPSPSPSPGPSPTYRTMTDPATGITVSGNLSEGATLIVADLALGNSTAEDAIRRRMQDDDYVFILGKNISLSGSFTGMLTLSLPVGTQYNGETVTILHAKQDGTLEPYTVKVKHGKATFYVSSLSPFAVFADAADGPKTGDDSSPWIWWTLLAVSVVATMTLVWTRKKALQKR